MEKIISLNNDLLNKLREEDFKGYDPFDFLNSKIFQLTPFKYSKICKLIFTQLGKRSVINLRNILFVPKSRNAKGVALVVLGLIEDYKRSKDKYFLDNAKKLVQWLLDSTCDKEKWNNNCWGYNFEWQAKAFNVPFGTPNIVTTYFVSLAIYKFSILINDQNLQKEALSSAYFMNEHLLSKRENNDVFNYVPNYKAFVHNANLFGAYWCLLSGTNNNDKELIDKSMSAIEFSIKDQKSDGSWIYGHQSHHQWIDSFHTGYNLEILNRINKILNKDKYADVIDLGYQYYLKTFILNDGRVKYFDNSIYPLDVHAYSQAIITVKMLEPNNIDLLNKIVNSLIEQMYLSNSKRFIYQKGRYLFNKINYFRWTQAWAYYSLSTYNNFISEKN